MLTIEEVAHRLNMPVETVHRWIRQGKIPMQQNSGKYTIRAEMLERWAKIHNLEIGNRLPSRNAKPTGEQSFDGILPAMQRGGLFYDIEGNDRHDVCRQPWRPSPALILPTDAVSWIA